MSPQNRWFLQDTTIRSPRAEARFHRDQLFRAEINVTPDFVRPQPFPLGSVSPDGNRFRRPGCRLRRLRLARRQYASRVPNTPSNTEIDLVGYIFIQIPGLAPPALIPAGREKVTRG